MQTEELISNGQLDTKSAFPAASRGRCRRAYLRAKHWLTFKVSLRGDELSLSLFVYIYIYTFIMRLLYGDVWRASNGGWASHAIAAT